MTFRVPRLARLGVAALLAAISSGAARADTLDQVLYENARPVLGQLTDSGYANVGVLKFEILRGLPGDHVPLAAGQLGDLMATRLENALILAVPDGAPVGVVRGVGRVAAGRDAKATDRTADGRAKLLAGQYPLAWGKKSVTPDALLVGRVLFDPELKTATVSLRVFDRKDPAAPRDVPLSNARVKVTRQTLADADQPFVVPGRLYQKRGGADLPDPQSLTADDVAQAVVQPFHAKTTPPETARQPEELPAEPRPTDIWAEVDKVLDFRVYYGGQEVRRQANGNYPDPKPGQEVYVTLKATERLGVVLLVNGINTADHDRSSREVNSYTKWVLEPWKVYWVRGYYDDKDKKVHKFEAAEDAAGVRELSGLAPADRFGLIELHVYKEVGAGLDDTTTALASRVMRDDPGPADSLAEAKLAIKQAIARASTPVKRSLIIPGKAEDAAVETASFRGSLMAQVTVRYSAAAGK